MLTAAESLEFIKNNKRVAIVGLSPKEDRPSHVVGKYLFENGYNILPVNPGNPDILGQKGVKALSELQPGDVDWIDMFVGPARLMGFLDEILRLAPGMVWCQIGVVNEEFNQKLEAANIPYVANICPKIELQK